MTKCLYTLILLLLGNAAQAATITKWQEKQVLGALKTYCGNAWCEGDYEYRFKSLKCEAKGDSCLLGIVLISRTEKARSTHSCRFAPVRNFREIMSDEGGPDALNDGFLEFLDECFEKAENRASR